MYRYVKGPSGKILDTYKQAIKYGMSAEDYWSKFSFQNCEGSNNIEDLIPEVFTENIDLLGQTGSRTDEIEKVEYFINLCENDAKKAVLIMVEKDDVRTVIHNYFMFKD